MKKRISVSSAKAKGRAFQQSIRSLFCQVGNLAPEVDVASRQMGGAGEDVVWLTEKAKENFGPFYVECKQQKTGFNPHLFFESLKQRVPQGRFPILFHRRDRHETLVTMELELFQKFLADYIYARTPRTAAEVEEAMFGS